MKAVGYQKSLPVSDPQSLQDIELEMPRAHGRDLLVHVEAIAVNPVDYKIRQWMQPEDGEYRVLGWDAVGEVVATGEAVSRFKPGDKVYYAGDLNRQGSNAEYQLVDERLVGHKPNSLSNSEAAALPLTAITAWELAFDHLALPQQGAENMAADDVVLVTGAAGGVGSILVQLLKCLTRATVIGTASRPASRQWIESLGADYVLDHSQPLKPQIDALIENGEIKWVSHVASLNATENYFDTYIEVLKPFGKIAIIDDPESIDIAKIKPKSLSFHYEFMFARSMFQADDMQAQGQLLDRLTELVDAGQIKTTLARVLSPINAHNLRAAHEGLESGKSIGKIVLEGF